MLSRSQTRVSLRDGGIGSGVLDFVGGGRDDRWDP